MLWSVMGPTSVSNRMILTDHDDHVLNLYVYRFRANIFPRYADLQAANLTVDEFEWESECLKDVFFYLDVV